MKFSTTLASKNLSGGLCPHSLGRSGCALTNHHCLCCILVHVTSLFGYLCFGYVTNSTIIVNGASHVFIVFFQFINFSCSFYIFIFFGSRTHMRAVI